MTHYIFKEYICVLGCTFSYVNTDQLQGWHCHTNYYATAVYPVFPITLLLELIELHDCDRGA